VLHVVNARIIDNDTAARYDLPRSIDKMKKLPVWSAACFLLAAGPLPAHHSFAAEYDQKQPITIKGVVTKLDWMNPHVYFYVDATDSDGKVTHWACEAGNPNALARRGWRKDSLKAGDQIVIQAFRAKDATSTVNARTITLADGKKIFAGSADDGGPDESKGPLN
jgi:hypothetical protein